MGRERLGVAEGANNEGYESLRQRRPLHDASLESAGIQLATNEESRKVKLSGTRTEVTLVTTRGTSVLFHDN